MQGGLAPLDLGRQADRWVAVPGLQGLDGVTSNPIKVLPDGTRVYSNYIRYVPVPEDERKYGRRKPDDPRAVFWSSRWWLPLELLPMEEREWPLTRPDTDAYDHAGKRRRCKCDVCRRPEARRWRNQWRREQRAQMRGGADFS